MTATVTVHELEARDQKISQVKVFTDRAEVRRLVKVSLKSGVNEVILKNLTQNLFAGSMRVEGRGNATIYDVVVKNSPSSSGDSVSPKIATIRSTLKEEKARLQSIEDRGSIVQKSIENLDKVFGQVGGGLVNPPKEGGSSLNEGTLTSLKNFFDFYGSNSETYREKLRAIETEHREQQEKVRKVEQELNLLQSEQHRNSYSQSAIITLECSQESDAELDIIYQVNNSGWSPSYDIRVDTEKSSMQITYFGKIRQHTNEDWNGAPLVLSTAQPCLGGKIPELGTLEAVFRSRYVHQQAPMVRATPGGGNYALFGAAPSQMVQAQTSPFSARVEPPPPPMEVAVASEVTQNTLSTEFKILREATIPHGTNDHKVTVGIVTLSPKLVHETVPSKNSSAFLTASAINTSELAFLSGDSSVYLNNAFVAKSHLKNVSPGERFTCSLGVDTAIRVEYKPAKKYHEEGGYITKHSANVTEQTIYVKNTRSEQPVLLTIKHHVPRSTDEKIRVKLVSPSATPYDPEKATNESENAEPVEGAKFNSSNNLEWTVKLAPNSSQDLVIKYVVEHPKDETVQYHEKF
uniref:Mucoidy inhibitor MuiA family protein n=1 Tax=Caenorhabditis tropicalis TaxID=1561998 RepID=A0A1I7TFH0_9PELO